METSKMTRKDICGTDRVTGNLIKGHVILLNDCLMFHVHEYKGVITLGLLDCRFTSLARLRRRLLSIIRTTRGFAFEIAEEWSLS